MMKRDGKDLHLPLDIIDGYEGSGAQEAGSHPEGGMCGERQRLLWEERSSPEPLEWEH